MSIQCYKQCILGRTPPERDRDPENTETEPGSTVFKGNIANKVENKANEEKKCNTILNLKYPFYIFDSYLILLPLVTYVAIFILYELLCKIKNHHLI